MLKNLLALLFLSLFIYGGCSSIRVPSDYDILGIKIGMNKEDAAKRLNEIGKLQNEESNQQEVWALTDKPHYSFLIIGFNKKTQKVRFITAKARENGSRVSYGDVLDIGNAQQQKSANNYKYIQEIPGSTLTFGYTKIASGTDPNYLTYFSLKELNSSEEEEDDDEEK